MIERRLDPWRSEYDHITRDQRRLERRYRRSIRIGRIRQWLDSDAAWQWLYGPALVLIVLLCMVAVVVVALP